MHQREKRSRGQSRDSPSSYRRHKCTENEMEPSGHGRPMLALAFISRGRASAWICAETPAETQTLSTQTPALTLAEKSPEMCGCGVTARPMSTLPLMYADATELSPTLRLMLSPPPMARPVSESMTYMLASVTRRWPSMRGPCCLPASMCHGPLGPKWMSTAALLALLPMSTEAMPPRKLRWPHKRPSKLLPAYWRYPWKSPLLLSAGFKSQEWKSRRAPAFWPPALMVRSPSSV